MSCAQCNAHVCCILLQSGGHKRRNTCAHPHQACRTWPKTRRCSCGAARRSPPSRLIHATGQYKRCATFHVKPHHAHLPCHMAPPPTAWLTVRAPANQKSRRLEWQHNGTQWESRGQPRRPPPHVDMPYKNLRGLTAGHGGSQRTTTRNCCAPAPALRPSPAHRTQRSRPPPQLYRGSGRRRTRGRGRGNGDVSHRVTPCTNRNDTGAAAAAA